MPLGRRRRTFQGTGTLAAPVNSVLPSVAGLPGVGVQLSCFFGVWTGFPTPTFSYQWKRDGTTDIGTNSPFYTQVSGDLDALITCVVTATNSQGSANATSNAVGPVVALPVNNVAPVASGTAVVGQTATVASGDWTGALSYLYQWFENSVLVPGATLTSFLLSTAGASVYCRVTGVNTGGNVSVNSNTIGPVGLAPQNTVLPALSGGGAAGQAISLSTGAFAGYPASYTYTRRYYADGVLIAGQSGATFTPTHLQAGKVITGSVVATNSTGSSAEVFASNSVGPITSPPVFDTDPVLTGAPAVDQVLTVATNGLYGYPVPTLAYTWYDDGVLIAAADQVTFTLTGAQEGGLITAMAVATNTHGSDSATTNSIGPVTPPEPIPGEWDWATEDNFILVTEDGERLVTEDYTTDLLTNLVLTPKAGGKTASFELDARTNVGLLSAIVVPQGTFTPPAPFPADIEDWAVNGGNPAVKWSTWFNLTAAPDGHPGISGLTQNSDYDFYTTVHLSSIIDDFTNVLTDSFSTLDAAPELADLIVAAKSTTAAVAGWTTTDQTGSSKWAVYVSSATPTDDQVIAGTGAVVFGSKTNTATGKVSLSDITGLSAGQSYTFYVIQIDANTNRSNRVSFNFSTPAVQATVFAYATDGDTTGLTLSNLTKTTGRPDPLGGDNAVKLGHDPAGASKICYVHRTTSGFVVPTTFEQMFFIKKNEWASSSAWIRWRPQNVAAQPYVHFNLDTGAFSTPSDPARITNLVAVPLEDGFWFVKLTADILAGSAPYDTNGDYRITLARSGSDATIQASGLHAVTIFDFKIVSH